MAATEASAAPVVQEDGKAAETTATEQETKATEAEPVVPAPSETVSDEKAGKDGEVAAGNATENKETVANDTAAGGGEEGAGEEAPPSSENPPSSTEPKTSFLDSFLNKSGLGKVMSRKKKEEEPGADKEPEKGEEAAPGAEGGAEENGEKGEEEEKKEEEEEEEEKKEEEKKEEKKEEKARSSVRDMIRNPVARMFSHRSTDKKEGGAEDAQPKGLTVRSRSLDRLEPPEEAPAASSSDAPPPEGGAEEEQKASAAAATSSTKHMKRWHSFKKLMAQKAHRKGGAGSVGEEVREEEGEGGGDSSTLDSKDSGQKRWKLKRSWTFQGLKRDPSMVGLSSKAKEPEEPPAEGEGAEGEGGEGAEEKVDGEEEAPGEGGEEKEAGAEEAKAEGGAEEKAGASGGTVGQHANEIWTSFKKRVIPKSKRPAAESAPAGEEEPAATAAAPAGEEAEEGKCATAKRSKIGRAMSLKNFIMRKGKTSSVELGEGAKEEGGEGKEEEGGDTAAKEGEEPAVAGEAVPAAAAETNDAPASAEQAADEAAKEAEPAKELEPAKEAEPEKPAKASETPVTNGENGCTNGDEHGTHNHHDDEREAEPSPMKKGKEEPKAQIISSSAPLSDQKAGNV
ncbi:sodium/potassium/calcium exchanger 1 [Gadus morhua]|uniref:Uncharacterized protein n=1 Tax=Gadus morhua TaxID=8049 RepID=A0A8C5BEB5_GADMO|nr:sodium/potassium/calcium exchanger 1-like [Gadus morhua]